jgi:5-formyltetrahydrofolate cyclo-ligase
MPYRVPVDQTGESIAAAKSRLRAELTAARRARSDEARQAARDANSAHLRLALREKACIAAYLPLPTEPLDPHLLDELAATRTVLVPVVIGAEPLDWCEYPGPVRRGAFGIDEPTGPRLGPDAIGLAGAILIPALAVDRRGHRLGRGGGHYDRTLALHARLLVSARAAGDRSAPATALRIALLYDGEILDTVPFDGLDQQVSAYVTPRTGVLPTT